MIRQAFFLCLTILLGFFLVDMSFSFTNHAEPNVEAAIAVEKLVVVAKGTTNENTSTTFTYLIRTVQNWHR